MKFLKSLEFGLVKPEIERRYKNKRINRLLRLKIRKK